MYQKNNTQFPYIESQSNQSGNSNNQIKRNSRGEEVEIKECYKKIHNQENQKEYIYMSGPAKRLKYSNNGGLYDSINEDKNFDDDYVSQRKPQISMYDSEEIKNEEKNLIKKHVKNLDEFEDNQYNMNLDQVVLNNIMLKIESEVLLGKGYISSFENSPQIQNSSNGFKTKNKSNFIDFIRCCENKFSSFNDFVSHKEKFHLREMNELDDIYINKFEDVSAKDIKKQGVNNENEILDKLEALTQSRDSFVSKAYSENRNFGKTYSSDTYENLPKYFDHDDYKITRVNNFIRNNSKVENPYRVQKIASVDESRNKIEKLVPKNEVSDSLGEERYVVRQKQKNVKHGSFRSNDLRPIPQNNELSQENEKNYKIINSIGNFNILNQHEMGDLEKNESNMSKNKKLKVSSKSSFEFTDINDNINYFNRNETENYKNSCDYRSASHNYQNNFENERRKNEIRNLGSENYANFRDQKRFEKNWEEIQDKEYEYVEYDKNKNNFNEIQEHGNNKSVTRNVRSRISSLPYLNNEFHENFSENFLNRNVNYGNYRNLDVDLYSNNQYYDESNEIEERDYKNRRIIYKCTHVGCGNSYTSKAGYLYHIRGNHSKLNVFKPFKCTVSGCLKKYKNANGLKYHLENSHKMKHEN